MEPNVEACGGCLLRKRPKETFVCNDYEEMSEKVAGIVASVLKEKPDALIGLTADLSLQRAYEILISMSENGMADFSRAHFVQFHEVIDPARETPVLGGFLRRVFLDGIKAREDQILFFNAKAADLPAECERMDNLIEQNGDIDCLLLGIGPRAQDSMNPMNCSTVERRRWNSAKRKQH